MSELTNSESRNLGEYHILATMTSGTAVVQIEVNKSDGTYTSPQDVTGTSLTAAGNVVIKVPQCRLSAVTTGDAVVYIDQIRRY